MKILLSTCFFLLIGMVSFAQQYTLSGYVKDLNTGETLIGANIVNLDNPVEGVSSNLYGFFSLTLKEGTYRISCSYLGYSPTVIELTHTADSSFDFELSEGLIINEVTISAKEEQKDNNVQSTRMGTVEMPVENIKKLPALLGEVDVLKAIQLLPGVMSSGEGSAGFYVRGGGPDQNLVLLDEAVVYNTGHLLGFFSVFNADAIKNTTLIKGGMPASYGGRLSSVVDIQMREGNDDHYQVEGGIGLISSRLTVQGPVVKDKSSFLISGRRTYALDLAQPALKGSTFEGTNYYFYDFNTKWNYKISKKDRIYLSGYFGRDVLKFRQPDRDFYFDIPYGNSTATLRWNHLFSDKMFFNLSAIYNDYKFEFDGGQADFMFNLKSSVEDFNLKLDFDYFPSPKHTVKYGLNITYHTLSPNSASVSNGEVDFVSEFVPKYGQEIGIYIQDEIRFSTAFSANLGLRYSMFSQLGPHDSKLDGQVYGRFQPVINYGGLEPRVNLKYSFSPSFSMKGSVALTNQYIHLVTNSANTLPTDIWVPSTELIKPQRATQYALGFFKNVNDAMLEASIELYYKDLDNQLDYADDYVETLSAEVQESFVTGKGRAYGSEFFVRKNRGKLTGWIGYTLAKTERSFPDIEDGRWYPAVYDRRHDLAIVANYEISNKLELGGTFVYGTGRWFTPYRSFYFIEGNIAPEYGPRNSAQLDAYHRIDLSLTYTPKVDQEKKFVSSWNFSIYNAYSRKNPFFLYYESNVDQESGLAELNAYKVTIFPIIPSITWNFKWNQKVRK